MSETTIGSFLAWAENDKERSVHTISRYREVLMSVAEVADPFTITQAEMETWWESRILLPKVNPVTGERERRASGSRANELFCLRTFYKWASRFDHRYDDPTRRLDPPKAANHVPRPIGKTELEQLVGPLTKDDPEMRRAIALGGYGGLRVSEAAAMDWRDVDVEGRRLYVRGKGFKERPVAVSPLLLDLILPSRPAGNIVTGTDVAYAAATLQRKVNRFLTRHGVSHTFHDLRKRGVTQALNKGCNPMAVKMMFGWASLETAMSYAAVGSEELDEIAAAMM